MELLRCVGGNVGEIWVWTPRTRAEIRGAYNAKLLLLGISLGNWLVSCSFMMPDGDGLCDWLVKPYRYNYLPCGIQRTGTLIGCGYHHGYHHGPLARQHVVPV